ncbi:MULTISPECIES: hypothetical protein [unclassified Haematospirillum]|uniref:hypothetical protein n=1 Tax=unclassified Haematospirillum TaxID=2622088 RepID=UPI001438B56D|nr:MULTISPECIES: hypothetical protein [unclassified Haematospirillum]NKD55754.1 hypothetical protein [Haematospirillum sp. H4890]NKD75811.1 hypothetical protein [Haematospirillum sp. H4485]
MVVTTESSDYDLSVLPRPGEDWPIGTHFVTVPDLETARRLFGSPDHAVRVRKSALFYRGIEARQRLPQGMHDRGEEYAIADGRLHEADRAGLANHLPLHVKVIRLSYKRLAQGEIWDVSVRHGQWPGLDYMEELYVFVHVDHLVLEEGARITVSGNVLFLVCGTLERVDPVSSWQDVAEDRYDIAVLPTPFSVDRQLSPNTGCPGVDGLPGDDGVPGMSVEVEGSLFGPVPVHVPAQCHAGDGGSGLDGGHGVRGRNGGMCKVADIRIARLVGCDSRPLRIFSCAGSGAPGGSGGQGGRGGNGGQGGNGIKSLRVLRPSGDGGAGGHGGRGGHGGQGGNGGLSSNIFVQVPVGTVIRSLSLPSLGGPGGSPGSGGLPGLGGAGGRALPGIAPGRRGCDGLWGADGLPGRPGRSRLGAGIFVIECDRFGPSF